MLKPLLIEIGVEELPALPLLKIINDIEKNWAKILEHNRLLCEFEFFYTPRRLVLWHPQFPVQQSDSKEELWGPPTQIAYDKDGKPTKAALGFAKKCGVDLSQIDTKERGGKAFLYYFKQQEGQKSAHLLQQMLGQWLESMAFGKMMRWGERKDEFIRPLRWLMIKFVKEEVDNIELFGVKNDSQKTCVHKMAHFDPVEVEGYQAYFFELAAGGVTLYQDKRRKKILDDFDNLERKHGITIDRDKALLDEVVAITENPNALLGGFDKAFLQLPKEVVITSMKEHQRYFPVFKDGELTNSFVVVSNAYTDDFGKVVAGNERVLRPRLADAMFFYENDLKAGLNPQSLESIGFMQGLGSVHDKVKREEKIGRYLAAMYGIDKDRCSEAINLAKADLTTEMVDEFGKLQGLMGYYYAKALGKDADVALAIKEQYLPLGEKSALPSSQLAAVVAMANKLDTLMGLFSIGKIPTGSKDPFALRRAVNGIIAIVLKYGFAFDIKSVISQLSMYYEGFDQQKLEQFVIERIYKSFDYNRSLITAVLESGERDIVRIDKKLRALDAIVQSSGFAEVMATFKRVANISKDVNLQALTVDENLFEQPEEKQLFAAFAAVQNRAYETYEQRLDALFGLKEKLDTYFDNVMVNADNEAVKTNRQNTIGSIYAAFKNIADIKEISV